MKILIDEDKCTACGTCSRVCPQMILELVDKKVIVRDIDRCMGCFGCEDECRQDAIRLMRAPGDVAEIEIEPPLNVSECDVAIVGAGPAGLGAAITCARAGLDTVVLERLPGRKLSHHTDGGVLFTLPFITSMKLEENRLTFPELDISIDSGFMRRCDFIGLMGPDGLSTRSEVPPDIEGYAGNKDAFVEALINEAEKAGAGFWFNAKVVDVIRDNDQVKGLRLDTGQEIHSKVVVTADGVFAKISEKVGMNICHDDVWYAEVLAYEYENTPELPAGLYYFNGDMQYEQDMPTILGGFGVTDVIHVLVAVFSRRKYHCAPKPLDHYVELMLEKDRRIRQIAGDSLKGMRPSMLTGCRGVFREKPNREIAGNGVISVGDAWVDDGELGNVPALANGVHAGRCITAASENSDFSKESLSEADSFISSKLVDVLSKNKNFKLMGATLSNDELRRMFLFMQHMNYPVMMLGSPVQQGLMFTNFMIRNFFRFFRYPGTLKRMF